MKCRIKSSGEIVDVIGYSLDGSSTNYIDENGIDMTGGLDYRKDLEPIIENNIDWEQRRYELAKSAMQGILSNSRLEGIDANKEAILFADDMIKQLKEKQNEV